MAKILVVGAGFAGHFAAMTLSRELKKRGLSDAHQVTVIARVPFFNYIPSLIWVGIGKFPVEKVKVDLRKVYHKLGIHLETGRVFEMHPDEKYALAETEGNPSLRLDYDYVIMATGPFLNFAATPGLGPDKGFTMSVCTPDHAVHTAGEYQKLVDRLEKGGQADIVIGTGHGTCTCQGAALEFLFNVHFDLVHRGLRDRTTLTWLSNEPRLGDLGISGVEVQKKNMVFSSEELITGLFEAHQIKWQVGSHVREVTRDNVQYETLDGEIHDKHYDFAMLLPPFKGQPIRYVGADGSDLTEQVCNPAGFVKVDAVYGKAYPDLDGPDWPKTYQSPMYRNLFAAGIAFAPPGPLSTPQKSVNGTPIAPAPPRTGYTSELCGKAAALNIIDLIEGREPSHQASLAATAGLCVASMDKSLTSGNAVIVGVYPVARNRSVYPEYGRDLSASAVDVGLSGAWIKRGLHTNFMHKFSAKVGWQYLP